MNNHSHLLPHLNTDLLLLHAPAFYDFRGCRDVYFPFLSTSGDVPITPLYEYFPIGFKALQRFLTERGHDIEIINLCTVLLSYPDVDFKALIEACHAKLIGIDLHWMVHVQGSLAVSKKIKELHGVVPVVMGGISSTYYANQLIQYPFIDMVMRGYNTLLPMAHLLEAIKADRSLDAIPNLLWKSKDGEIHDNGFSYKPSTFGCGINWSHQPPMPTSQTLPILELLSNQNAGCSYNCGWCGGSRDAFQRIFKCEHKIVRKLQSEIEYEFNMMNKILNLDQYHIYFAGSYNESNKGTRFFLDRVGESNFKSINYEQFYLTPDNVLKHMVQANKRTIITLSPESHDQKVACLAGRGVYTNEELEHWIERALDLGIHQVDIWYFIGMPEQDEKSVLETVDYCKRILEMFQGKRVNPMICPMIPFLDPGSTFFEFPDKYGYRTFFHTIEDHRQGMERASIINRINYETKWLDRHDLVYVGFKAVWRLMQAKYEMGFLPMSCTKEYNSKIDDALDFIGVVHEVDCIVDDKERTREIEKLGNEIMRRNNMIFFNGVMNQAFPLNRQIGGRWFDEKGWEPHILEVVRKKQKKATDLSMRSL